MTPAQRAVLAKAKKDGLKPSEQASEFMLYDVVEACIQQMKNYSVAWKNLSEKEQDASIANLTESLKETVTDAIQIIMSAGAAAIPFKLKKLSIDGKLTVTGLVEGDHPQRHALTDKAHDKSEILLILSPRDYYEGLETIKGERDQKSLPLDTSSDVEKSETSKPKTEAKATGKTSKVSDIASAVAFKPEELAKAQEFVEKHRTPTTAGIQNMLSIGFNKAEGILAELARQGIIVETVNEEDGKVTYTMPPLANTGDGLEPGADLPGLEPADEPKAEEPLAKPLTKAQQKKADADAKKKAEAAELAAAAQAVAPNGDDQPNDFSGTTELTDDLYEAIKRRVIERQEVSAGGMAVFFNVDIPLIDEAIDRLEMETVISEEDEMGGRVVYDTE